MHEAKQEDEAANAVRKQLDDDLKLEMSAKIDRRRIETDSEIRSELCESNKLSRFEIVEAKQKHEAAKAVRKQLDDELVLESIAEVDRKIVAEVDKRAAKKAKEKKIEKAKAERIEEEAEAMLRKELIDAIAPTHHASRL